MRDRRGATASAAGPPSTWEEGPWARVTGAVWQAVGGAVPRPGTAPRGHCYSVGAGAEPASPFQSLPAASACTESLAVWSATRCAISSSDRPSPAAWVWLLGSLITHSPSIRRTLPSPGPRSRATANQRVRSGQRGRELEPHPLAAAVLVGPPAIRDRLHQPQSAPARAAGLQLLDDGTHGGAVDDRDAQPALRGLDLDGQRHL